MHIRHHLRDDRRAHSGWHQVKQRWNHSTDLIYRRDQMGSNAKRYFDSRFCTASESATQLKELSYARWKMSGYDKYKQRYNICPKVLITVGPQLLLAFRLNDTQSKAVEVCYATNIDRRTLQNGGIYSISLHVGPNSSLHPMRADVCASPSGKMHRFVPRVAMWQYR